MKEEQIAGDPPEKRKFGLSELIFLAALVFCFTPFASSSVALLLGLVVANTTGHPYLSYGSRATGLLLRISVVGLGFGINVHKALDAGREGFGFTVAFLFGTLFLGILLGKWMKVDAKTAYLVSGGTAICGGSAIAAISPVIRAEEKQISVALGIVFVLNSIALFVFPLIGHWLSLSQQQFGIWSAIAIHDTSSVVGAAGRYGNEALQVATTVKLARTLWIIPLALLSALIFKTEAKKIRLPYFIGFYILAVVAVTYIAPLAEIGPQIAFIAKKGLRATLFLIGAGLNFSALRTVGIRPMLQGLVLWLVVCLASLCAVLRLVA